MALLVHRRIREDKKVDRHVIKEMKIEGSVGVMALILLIIAYVLNMANLY